MSVPLLPRRRAVLTALFALCGLFAAVLLAQAAEQFPSHQVTLVVPLTPAPRSTSLRGSTPTSSAGCWVSRSS